ncbi:PREDICTED: uncharacterized protein LOC109219507 [Nicotiana attenuata]|uniref:Thionin-like protein 2 n=1 Tax=Nicotiana attenuata TaxID=49451 RepID=A0A1J6KGD5_NICAT|nr:PREDICTED: uncharacterized protein LOC109219507 [Nicotiana attenuata]OIT20959.1 hypothetical protein A4A49_36946 [Nicotiana attenuata]
MAVKGFAVLFVAMLLMSIGHSMAQKRDPICVALCGITCGTRPLCLARCLARCFIASNDTLDESHSTSVEASNRVCNVGCSLGHCSEFLFQYDNEKFGTCMSSCSENYCIGNNSLEKA